MKNYGKLETERYAKKQADFCLLNLMIKQLILIVIFCAGLANMVAAQQKKPVKITPPKKIYFPPPPKPKREPIETSTSPNGNQGFAPTVMVSAEETKYNRERICRDCDTLILEPNKKHILIYDVKWMSDSQSRTYREQPTAKDLDKEYYALNVENKREWDELKVNFSENDFSFHHIYRNTYIQTPNKAHQTLNLLDMQQHHEGFLYWNGDENDSTINREKMVLLTETVAKQTGENKKSSYYAKFLKDSLSIVNYQQTKNPSANLVANMNTFLLKEIFNQNFFPLQLFDVNKVSKINVQSQTEERKKINLKLNDKGQLLQVIERTDTTTITYKNNWPVSLKERNKISNIYYKGDTVITKDNNYLKISKLVDKMFFELKTYLINEDDYAKMSLDNGFESKLSNKDNNICLKNTNETRETTIIDCFSNTNWQLPLNLTNKTSSDNRVFESKTIYNKTENKLIIEHTNSVKSIKMEYELVNDRPIAITTYVNRENGEYGKDYALSVTYEYYK